MAAFRLFGRQPKGDKPSNAGLTGESMRIDMAEVANRRAAERDAARTTGSAPAPIGSHAAGFADAQAEAGRLWENGSPAVSGANGTASPVDATADFDTGDFLALTGYAPAFAAAEKAPEVSAPANLAAADTVADEVEDDAPIGKHAAAQADVDEGQSSSDSSAADEGDSETSAWSAVDDQEGETCPNCGASVGFARRCPECGTPLFAAAPALEDDADGEDDEVAPASGQEADAQAAPTPEDDALPAKPDEESEQDRIVAAARQIRAQAAEEQVAAVQSRLLRDKRLMAEINQIISEETALKAAEKERDSKAETTADEEAASSAGAETPMPASRVQARPIGRAFVPDPLPQTQETPTDVADLSASSLEGEPATPDVPHQIRPGVVQPAAAAAHKIEPLRTDALDLEDQHVAEGDLPMADPTPFVGNHAAPAQQRSMRIMSSEAVRSGTYADIANAMTMNGRTIVDFFMIDRPDVEPGVDEAVHQARIVMQPDAVVALRDMLTDHIERFYSRSE